MRAGSSAATPETAWSRSFSPKWPDPNQLRRDPALPPLGHCATASPTLRRAARSQRPSFRGGSDCTGGATLYIGRILTRGRSEVTALGEEVNETARIEACATSGRTLASKSLIERLDRADAEALGVDTRHTTYTPLADLATATDKARRDAPAIAVCEV
jgi:class 3 adenylate cyclase